MNKLFNYAKLVSIFLIIELLLTFLMSILNLLGVNSGITTIIMFITNIIIFFTLAFYNAKIMKKRGFLEGMIIGAIYIILMMLIKFILFHGPLKISTFIYYLILFITSVFGGMVGVNKTEKQ